MAGRVGGRAVLASMLCTGGGKPCRAAGRAGSLASAGYCCCCCCLAGAASVAAVCGTRQLGERSCPMHENVPQQQHIFTTANKCYVFSIDSPKKAKK